MDSKELKIAALKEVISRDKVNYEDQIADLRVEITELSQRFDQVQAEKNELQTQVDGFAQQLSPNEVVEGEVVQEEVSTRAKKTAK